MQWKFYQKWCNCTKNVHLNPSTRFNEKHFCQKFSNQFLILPTVHLLSMERNSMEYSSPKYSAGITHLFTSYTTFSSLDFFSHRKMENLCLIQ